MDKQQDQASENKTPKTDNITQIKVKQQQPPSSTVPTVTSTPKPTLQQKQALSQQAKNLLLKQCYKISTTKYLRLLSLGPQGFTQRQWSIIHVNTAICYQFQQKFVQALQKLNQAIKIDPFYEKAYYRRLQVLDQMGQIGLIAEGKAVPQFVRNPEIQALRKEILEKWKGFFGVQFLQKKLEDLQQTIDLIEDKTTSNTNKLTNNEVQAKYKIIKQTQQNIMKRIDQQIESSIKNLRSINISNASTFIKLLSTNKQICSICNKLFEDGSKIGQYYRYLMNKTKVYHTPQIHHQKDNISHNDHNIDSKQNNKNRQIKYIIYKQLLEQIYQNIYKLCIKYLLKSNNTISYNQLPITQNQTQIQTQNLNTCLQQIQNLTCQQIQQQILLFIVLNKFWQVYIQLFITSQIQQRKPIFSIKKQQNTQDNSNTEYDSKQYQGILLAYCPLSVLCGQKFLSFFTNMFIVQPVPNMQLSNQKQYNTQLNINRSINIDSMIKWIILNACISSWVVKGKELQGQQQLARNMLQQCIILPMLTKHKQKHQRHIQQYKQLCAIVKEIVDIFVDRYVRKCIISLPLTKQLSDNVNNMNIQQYKKVSILTHYLFVFQYLFQLYMMNANQKYKQIQLSSKKQNNQQHKANKKNIVIESQQFVRFYRSKYKIQTSVSNYNNSNKDINIGGIVQQLKYINNIINHKIKTKTNNCRLSQLDIQLLYIVYQIIQVLQPIIYSIHTTKNNNNNTINIGKNSLQQQIDKTKQLLTGMLCDDKLMELVENMLVLEKGTKQEQKQEKIQVEQNSSNIIDYWNRKQIILKYMLMLNIVGYILPTFYSKIMHNNTTNTINNNNLNNNMKTNKNSTSNIDESIKHDKFTQILFHLCEISQIFLLLLQHKQKSLSEINELKEKFQLDESQQKTIYNFKQLLKIYMQSLTFLAISHPSFINKILQYPYTISNIYSILFLQLPTAQSSQKSKPQYNLSSITHLTNPIKLLYTLIIDLTQEQEQQYAQKMGVTIQEIRKAKQLQGENFGMQVREDMQKRKQKFVGVILGSQTDINVSSRPIKSKNNNVKNIDRFHTNSEIKNNKDLFNLQKRAKINQNNWAQILNQIVNTMNINNNNQHNTSANKEKNQKDKKQISLALRRSQNQNNMMLAVISKLSQKQASKFYSNPFITFMLHNFSTNKQTLKAIQKSHPHNHHNNQICKKYQKNLYKISLFFTKICKKCNVNIFSYSQLQPITNCLTYLLEKQEAKHQLEIFQSFLGLINLSAKNVIIDINIVYIGLLEENQYIVHGALQLFNNVIVNGGDNLTGQNQNQRKRFWGLYSKIQQLVFKYYKYYKNLVEKQIQQGSKATNTHDYSHPFKIYCTLFSVLMIMQSLCQSRPYSNPPPFPSIPQFQSWQAASKSLINFYKNNADISITLFKLVMHHVENKTLINGWIKGLEPALEKLKVVDGEKWGRLQRYIK